MTQNAACTRCGTAHAGPSLMCLDCLLSRHRETTHDAGRPLLLAILPCGANRLVPYGSTESLPRGTKFHQLAACGEWKLFDIL